MVDKNLQAGKTTDQWTPTALSNTYLPLLDGLEGSSETASIYNLAVFVERQ
jgi:hypothetical protein